MYNFSLEFFFDDTWHQWESIQFNSVHRSQNCHKVVGGLIVFLFFLLIDSAQQL